jgi:WD40 repeat protein
MLINNPSGYTGEEVAKPRKIASNPYRVLDAPGLCDDFYLNLVDWSS